MPNIIVNKTVVPTYDIKVGLDETNYHLLQTQFAHQPSLVKKTIYHYFDTSKRRFDARLYSLGIRFRIAQKFYNNWVVELKHKDPKTERIVVEIFGTIGQKRAQSIISSGIFAIKEIDCYLERLGLYGPFICLGKTITERTMIRLYGHDIVLDKTYSLMNDSAPLYQLNWIQSKKKRTLKYSLFSKVKNIIKDLQKPQSKLSMVWND